MFGRRSHGDAQAQIDAIGRSQAMITFNTDGTIVTANKHFLDVLGYGLGQIQGKHHSMFVPADQRDSADYQAFWAALRRGEFRAGEFKRIANGGREIWIEASYSPVLDGAGKPVKIVKIATDITAKKIRGMTEASKIAAISRAQAVIEFKLDGTVVTANENFCKALGYSLAEIEGKHHSLFVPPELRDSAAYREFWEKLNRGEYQSGEYKRVGKGGREVWILASYNPLLDETGKPFGVVKFATDVTAEKLKNADLAGQLAAIDKAQAVIEFDMDGTIIDANANFLATLGYSLAEIKGKHHSMFVEPSERDSVAYREFWAALNRGEYQAAEYKRIGKGGKEVYIQASYNPILDLNGKPFKVVKYATDTTKQVLVRMGNERVRAMMESVAAGSEELNASVRENLRGHDQVARDGDGCSGAGLLCRRAGPASHRRRAGDERHRRVDQQHHRADQPARAQCYDRIRARRRSGPRLCRGRIRGEGPCQPSQAGDRQDRSGDRQPEPDLGGCCRLAECDQAGDQQCQRVRYLDRRGDRGAEHGDERDVDQHAACCGRSCCDGGPGLTRPAASSQHPALWPAG